MQSEDGSDTTKDVNMMEKKPITRKAKLILATWNIGLFALVWAYYYNSTVYPMKYLLGMVFSTVLYGTLYMFLCNLYKGFRIASNQIGETVFSQFLGFAIADFFLYLQGCLIRNTILNIVPGALTVLMQIMGTAMIVSITKRYMRSHMQPKDTIIIYGRGTKEEEICAFEQRLLQKYAHLFHITKHINERDIAFCMTKEIQKTHTVLLYEVTHHTRKKVMKYAIAHKKTLYFTPTIEDITLQGCTEKHLLDTPLQKYNYVYEKPTEYTGKRAFDVTFALFLLVLTAPFMLLSALLIKLEDHGPVFFKQKRCTKGGREFEIIKFRSMIVDAEKYGVTPCTENDDRITKVGKFIRATRLDELPQLFNILKGDMSFVGPRPERVEHVEQYTAELPEFAYRMRVKGGLTGYAQIYGKYNTSAYDKLRLDLLYIENQSFFMDLKMILLTLKIMFVAESTEGFDVEKSKTMQEVTAGLEEEALEYRARAVK